MNSEMNANTENVIHQFIGSCRIISVESYGEGHINDTFAVCYIESESNIEKRIFLQRINHHIFLDPQGLMENIYGVTQFLKEKIKKYKGDVLRETLTVIKTQSGNLMYKDNHGNYWRCYLFIENTITYQKIKVDKDFYNCGAAFGNFQRLLSDYPATKLIESIADFHNTPKRYNDLLTAVKEDKMGRVKDVQNEIGFVLARKNDVLEITNRLNSGEIPLRVTHNDTKLNNILIDSKTGKAICIVDLDTIMPGAVCYDFGDGIRFGASTAAEDETDLSKVEMDIHLYEVFTEGYLSVAKEFLTEPEINSLAVGAKMMTLECGIRFLQDYINGDEYFKIHYKQQNLDRCRNQFKLVADMESKTEKMQSIVKKYSK